MRAFLMTQILSLQALREDRRAVTAMEYGLIAALVAVIIIGGLTTLGTTINTKFTSIATALNTSATGTPAAK